MKMQLFSLGARLAVLSVGLVLASVQSGCSQTRVDDGKATVAIRISAKDMEASEASLPGGPSRVASLSLVQPAQSANFSPRDVNRIIVTVRQGDTPLFVDVPMYRDNEQSTDWILTLELLPRGVPLLFIAKAFKDDRLLFSGQTTQALTRDNETVTIRLKPETDGDEISLPRIRRIYMPAEFVSEEADNVTFSIESQVNDQLTFEITPAAGGGQFVPAQGNFQMVTTLGAFVSQYIPPRVEEQTSYDHVVKVTNNSGYTVITTFSTTVVPRTSTPGVSAGVRVVFNPVITGLTAQRIGNLIRWTASTAPQTGISYTWSFTPSGSSEPFPSAFEDPTANPANLLNYDESMQGLLKLEITQGGDADARTTLLYQLRPGQFLPPVGSPPPTEFVSLVAGQQHTCALRRGGQVRCWGSGDAGRLGYGNEITVGDDEDPRDARRNPGAGGGAADIPGLEPIKQLAAGAAHTCAVLGGDREGYVRCWGNNSHGQLGYSHTADVGDGEPVSSAGYVQLGGLARKVVAGAEHSCALMDNGTVRCWGRNNHGQLGYNFRDPRTQPAIGDNEPVWTFGAVPLDPGVRVLDIAAGDYHTCALLNEAGKVRCWGRNHVGQLGYGHTQDIGDNELPTNEPAVDVGGPAVQIRAGGNVTCALLAVGNIRCWGENYFGQNGLGDGGWPSFRASPVLEVNLGGTAIDVAVGGQHVCALLAGGGVKCWGRGDSGQLGMNRYETQYAPVTDPIFMGPAARIAAGGGHTCALLTTGAVQCWGSNSSGQIGYPGVSTRAQPQGSGVLVLD